MSEQAANDLMREMARYARFNPVTIRPIKPGWRRYHVEAWDRAVSDLWTVHSRREWHQWLAGYGPR